MSDALDRLRDALTAHGCAPTDKGVARCPAHDDNRASLTFAKGDKGVVVCCHAACTQEAVVGALGLKMADLFDGNGHGNTRREVDAYDYTDETGNLLFQVVRFEPKDFRQRKPDGRGGWDWKLGDTRRVLYRLPAVLEAVAAGRPVYVVEGEKDVATLVGWGLDATCNPGGAGKGKWRPEYSETLRGARVVIIPDADKPGRDHAASIAASLTGVAADVRTVELPGAKDAAAWASGGGTREALEALVTAASPAPADGFTAAVTVEVERLRVRDAAARIVRLECAGALGALSETALVSLADFLAVADEPQRYRVEELWPVGGRVILAAAYKAGKTTLRDNLVRCLVDGDLFLGRFQVHQPAGRVVVIDTELDQRMLRRWLRDQHIANTDRVAVLPLRGRMSAFDILDRDTRARWADRLREAEAGVAVLDCLRPTLDALGLSEDKDAGRFLVAFDELLVSAGVFEAVVIHHAGHAGERSRGDSRLRDWPDAEWRLVREKAEGDGEPQPDARRFFAAFGRDVNLPEGLLSYDPVARRLRFDGGNRVEAAADRLVPELLRFLAVNPGLTGRQIESALVPPNPRDGTRNALKRAVSTGAIRTSPGPRRSLLHVVADPPVRECAGVRDGAAAHSESECASAPIGAHRAHTHPQVEGSSARPAHSDEPETEV